MFAFSGSGVYVVWLLADETEAPPPVTRDNLATRDRVARRFYELLQHLGADPVSLPLAHPFKAPGSITSNPDQDADYILPLSGRTRAPRLYGLDELAKLLDLQHYPFPARRSGRRCSSGKRRRKPGDYQRRVKRGKGGECCRKRVREIELLSDYRGGFHKGCREVALWLYYTQLHGWLYANAEDTPEARSKATANAINGAAWLAERFKPPLSESRVRARINSFTKSKKQYRFRNATLAVQLGVTEVEVAALGLESIVPGHIAQARKDAQRKAQVDR